MFYVIWIVAVAAAVGFAIFAAKRYEATARD